MTCLSVDDEYDDPDEDDDFEDDEDEDEEEADEDEEEVETWQVLLSLTSLSELLDWRRFSSSARLDRISAGARPTIR
jgi:hypothetical protein